MIKKIFFVIIIIIVTYFASFLTMYNETVKSIKSIINEAIVSEDYSKILAYNDYYFDTPIYSFTDENYVLSIHNSYDVDTQTLSIIIVDKNKLKGEQSELKITCEEEFVYEDIFLDYQEGNISVITLYQSGDDAYSLNNKCDSGLFNNLTIKANDGTVIASIDNEVGLIDESTIINQGIKGYSEEEIQDIQYPNGIIRPLLFPVLGLWLSVTASIFIYKKVFKKK